ncbi:DUF3445 domain-containing protein [Acidimicrobiaceae bacterium AH-315-P05]|nr:DUF3445 domain-containing protein [Acidimicrobiaceae bacterium AH-315-P05]
MAPDLEVQHWSEPFDWIHDLDLNPESSSLRIGTRHLGNRPWLIADSAAEHELRSKLELTLKLPAEVFAAFDHTSRAGQEVLDLVERSVGSVKLGDLGLADPRPHPLLRAGLSVQEDLCIMERRSEGWHLVAASLHNPSRWRLADKIGRHIAEVHAPVAGYADSMASRVDALLNGLGTDPILRRNWFIHEDDVLFQPVAPRPRIVATADCAAELTVRSERQTLRRFGDRILFTIRVQRCPLGVLLEGRANELRGYLFGAPQSEQARRGIRPEQSRALRDLFA